MLDNGLVLLMTEDHSIPAAAVHLRYNVGSWHERAGRTGLAHLLEHCMFEGTKLSPGSHLKRIRGLGGQPQGTTHKDSTEYYEIIPMEDPSRGWRRLEQVLWLESERMGFFRPGLRQSSLDKERKIVRQEESEGENEPYHGAYTTLREQAFGRGHPYARSIGGSMQGVDAVSLEDLRAFHAAYYRPDNAILVVTGNHDPARTLRLVRKWFGRILAPAGPLPERTRPQARPEGPREASLEDDKAPLARILLAYRVPGRGKPSWNELLLLARVLGGRETARLNRALVYDSGLAFELSVGLEDLEEEDLFVVDVTAAREADPEEVKAAVRAEISKLLEEGVDPRELSRVRAVWKTDRLDSLQDLHTLASSLADQEALRLAPAVDARVEEVLRIEPEALLQAARTYLRPDNATMLTILPKGKNAP